MIAGLLDDFAELERAMKLEAYQAVTNHDSTTFFPPI